jgi:hypothetical protein
MRTDGAFMVMLMYSKINHITIYDDAALPIPSQRIT